MTISQREGRRLKKRVRELETERARFFSRWSTSDYPGIWIAKETNATEQARLSVRTARTLGHAVVATVDDSDKSIHFYAQASK